MKWAILGLLGLLLTSTTVQAQRQWNKAEREHAAEQGAKLVAERRAAIEDWRFSISGELEEVLVPRIVAIASARSFWTTKSRQNGGDLMRLFANIMAENDDPSWAVLFTPEHRTERLGVLLIVNLPRSWWNGSIKEPSMDVLRTFKRQYAKTLEALR